jgi:hypothetical protein
MPGNVENLQTVEADADDLLSEQVPATISQSLYMLSMTNLLPKPPILFLSVGRVSSTLFCLLNF